VKEETVLRFFKGAFALSSKTKAGGEEIARHISQWKEVKAYLKAGRVTRDVKTAIDCIETIQESLQKL
jgi:hypothetical protein